MGRATHKVASIAINFLHITYLLGWFNFIQNTIPLPAFSQAACLDEGAQIILIHVVEAKASVINNYQHLDLILFQYGFLTNFLRLLYGSNFSR